ncbi:MAG: twin-arginine translocase TatA/TatE family subunit [Paludibacteraceae bacterium]|nr:twin-arginine translocase TatA/TatE family subunit [Paludibacteraceae bacterium]
MVLLNIGIQEILVIALIVLLLFGGKKIPELMRGLGRGVRSFKEGMNGIDKPDEEKKDDGQQPK